jgi:hypothetical protein
MSKIVWDVTGQRVYETGVSKGVLYPMSEVPGVYAAGVPWNGLSSVSESPSGAEVSPIYADNIKYLNLMSAEEFEASIEAFTYPDEFAACDGSAQVALGMFASQQTRKSFALCYQTKIGNDLDPEAGFKLHIIYGALASPTERAYETVNDSPEAMTFSWEISTTPVAVTGFKPTAHFVIDSTKASAVQLALLLDSLYGKDASVDPVVAATEPTLLTPDEIIALLGAVAG